MQRDLARRANALVHGVALVALAAAVSSRRLTDFDLPWHMAFGRLVVATRGVPSVDEMTLARPPIGYAEVVADTMLYGIERLGGAIALQIFGGLVAAAIGALMIARAREAGGAASVAASLGIVVMSSWLLVRPATLTFACLALGLFLIEEHRRAPDARRAKRALVLFVPLQLVWSNLHQGAPLGLAVLIGYLAYRLLARLARGRAPAMFAPRDATHVRFVAFVTLAATIATCVNRAGVGYLFRPAFVAPMSAIATEWQPTTLSFLAVQEPVAGVFLALSAIVIALGREPESKSRVPSLMHVGLALFGFALTFYLRLIPLAVVVVAPIAARRLAGVIGVTAPARVLGAIAALAAPLVVFVRLAPERGVGYEPMHFPEAAVRFIQANKPAGPMYNFTAFGGWLEWRLYPEYRPFIDARVLDYPMAVKAHRAQTERAVFDELLETFRFEWAVCRAREGERFCVPVYESSDWRMVYLDDASAIYLRKSGVNAELAKSGYKALRHLSEPGELLMKAVAPPSALWARALAFDGALAESQAPESARAALYGAIGGIAARDRARLDASRAKLARLVPKHPALPVLSEAFAMALANDASATRAPDASDPRAPPVASAQSPSPSPSASSDP